MKSNSNSNSTLYIIIALIIGFLIGKYLTKEGMLEEIEKAKNISFEDIADNYSSRDIADYLHSDRNFTVNDYAEECGYNDVLDSVFDIYTYDEIWDGDDDFSLYAWDRVIEEIEQNKQDSQDMDAFMREYYGQ